jgi:hypothetical protein
MHNEDTRHAGSKHSGARMAGSKHRGVRLVPPVGRNSVSFICNGSDNEAKTTSPLASMCSESKLALTQYEADWQKGMTSCLLQSSDRELLLSVLHTSQLNAAAAQARDSLLGRGWTCCGCCEDW